MTLFKYRIYDENQLSSILSKQLGVIFRETRAKRNLSQHQLSELANTNHSYYCTIENGNGNLTLKKFMYICYALDTDPASIIKTLNEATSVELDTLCDYEDFNYS
ncbi:MAG: helix-turn-helix transcriptional regulator [Clostridiaceae bacterium]|nr:helix-turn-helix transcriptional regulator [Clostridiaceae bacterium]